MWGLKDNTGQDSTKVIGENIEQDGLKCQSKIVIYPETFKRYGF